MNVRDFLDVRVICETGSLRKAAVAIGVSQPTLSNRVARLEDQLGAQLFRRSRGKSQPTDLARFIAERVSTMASEAEGLSVDVRRLASGKTGLVRIGLAAAPARVVFPRVVATLADRHPQISVDIVSGPTVQLTGQLLRRELDLLVCPPLEPPSDAVVSELQLQTDIIVVARPDHPLCSAGEVALVDLLKYPMALPTVEQRYLDILARDHGVDLQRHPGRILCSDPGTLVRIILESPRFVSAAPRPYFSPELESGELRVVPAVVGFVHSVYMHYNRDALPLPAVVAVQAVFRDAFAAMRGG